MKYKLATKLKEEKQGAFLLKLEEETSVRWELTKRTPTEGIMGEVFLCLLFNYNDENGLDALPEMDLLNYNPKIVKVKNKEFLRIVKMVCPKEKKDA